MSVKNVFPSYDDAADEDALALNERVADYVAGDLGDEDAAAMEALLRDDPDLAHEADLCRTLQDALPSAVHPSHIRPPGSGMADVLRQRLRNERGGVVPALAPAPKVILFRHNVPWLVAAAACVIAALSFIRVDHSAAAQNVYFDEFGAMVQLPTNSFALPQTVSLTAGSAPSIGGDVEVRPWLGVHAKPIDLEGFERNRGLLLINVTANSPAAKAGLRRGDVILKLGNMPLATQWCIPHAMEDLKPEQTVALDYWREGELKPQTTQVTLGYCSDLLKQ